MTNRILILILMLICCLSGANAQSSNQDFVQMCNEGKRLMRQCQYSAAYRLFDGAEGFAVTSSDKSEIARLQKQLKDSVNSTYNRGIKLIQKGGNANIYGTAIQELKKLTPTENLYVPQVYSWLGTAYERINEPYGAIEHYAQGVNHKERFSALRLASLLQTHKSVTRDSLVRLYEYAAPDYKEAYEILGDMFVSTLPQKAYTYYKNANSNRGKYKMASLLLEKKVTNDDDPIKMLQELSDANYADAQYYLGLLYFRERIKPVDTAQGIQLITAAKNNGHLKAKQFLTERNKQLRTPIFIYR